jgi:hypothetical protein
MARKHSLDPVIGRLSRYSGLRIEQSNTSVVVLAPREDGFDIRLSARDDRFVVAFDSWQRPVDDLETAWNLIAVGLSNGSRLRLEPTEDGRSLCWLEIVLPDGSWRTLPESGIDPNRLNSAVYYRQNSYVRAAYKDHAAFARTSVLDSSDAQRAV